MDGTEQVNPKTPPGRKVRNKETPISSNGQAESTVINVENVEQINTKEQLKEAFKLLCDVIISLLTLLKEAIKYGFTALSAKLNRFPIYRNSSRTLWMLFAFVIRKSCPDSKSKRKHLMAYMFGFIIGSFIYVSILNVNYALKYEGIKRKLLTVTEGYEYTTGPAPTTIRYTTNPYLQRGVTQKPYDSKGINKQNAGKSRLTYNELVKTLSQKNIGGSTKTTKEGGLTIPKIIHQSWHIKLVPKKFESWMASWRRNHPLWRHLFWTNKGGYHLVEKNYPHLMPFYKNYTSEFHQFKIHRYFLLYRLGGVFTDLDMESLKPLDDIISQYSCILTEQPLIHQAILFNQSAPNYVVDSFMACAPGHPFMKFLLEMLEIYQPYDSSIEEERERVEKSVGSLFLGDVLQLYRIAYNRTVAEHVHILPSELLMPNYNNAYLGEISKRCQNPSSLNPTAQQLCQNLLQTDFKNAVSEYAKNKCHWVDLYDEKTRYELAEQPLVAVDKIRVE